MKRKLLIGVVLVMAVVMAWAAMSKPDKVDHYETVKKCLTTVVNKEVDRNPLLEHYGAMATVMALNAMDEFLKKNLLVYEQTFYSKGIIYYQDKFILISVGAFGNVFMTVGEEDLQRLAERPEVMEMLGIEMISPR